MCFVHLLIFFHEEIILLCRLFVLLVKNSSYSRKKFIKNVKRNIYIPKVSNRTEFDVIGLQNIDNMR